MGQALAECARVLRLEQPLAARAELRAERTGAGPVFDGGTGEGAGAGGPADALQGQYHRRNAQRCSVERRDGCPGAAGHLRRSVAIGRSTPRDRGSFADAGVPLFPQSATDIETKCSCPDYANPCKHIAAVYYLLGERFDEDPFLIFALRGRTQQQMLDALRSRRAARVQIGEAAPVEAVPPLADLLTCYYGAGEELEAIAAMITAPEVEAAILRRLGRAPLGLDADLRDIYRAMTIYALHKVFENDD